jgi:hypothetical protein
MRPIALVMPRNISRNVRVGDTSSGSEVGGLVQPWLRRLEGKAGRSVAGGARWNLAVGAGPSCRRAHASRV